jgi:hypothetical protein
MDRDQAMGLLRGGWEGIREWNRRRGEGEVIPNLAEADLRGAHLSQADLTWANLSHAKLTGASLSASNLTGANLTGASLSEAILSRGDISRAVFIRANLAGARLDEVSCGGTSFNDIDLSEARGLAQVLHAGPSHISTSTLIRSRGKIPEAFLRGCGLTPWEVLSASLYDPALTPPQFVDLQYQILDAWTKGRSMINGCFISYSWKDARFVDTLRDRLVGEGVNVWLDRHDMVAGTIQDQVWRAIQIQHVVLLVLSEASTQSDWVENELDMARSKEKAEGRAVLCPVALDDAWKAKVEAKGGPGDPSRQLWRTLGQKLVVDFSRWETEAFEQAFGKLLRGLKVNYGP